MLGSVFDRTLTFEMTYDTDMPHRLDDTRLISRIDSGRMLRAVDRFGEYLRSRSKRSLRTILRPRVPAENLVFMGMGGSASAADVIIDWLRDRIQVPALVVREPSLPRFVARNSVFVGISYSGETAETIDAFRAAQRRGSFLVGVGSGGRLRTLCSRSHAPFLSVDSGFAPRAALSQLVAAVAAGLEALGFVKNVGKDIARASEELNLLRSQTSAEVSFSENLAKQMASSLKGRFPLVYSLERMSSVARRFRNQLAENSKVAANCGLLPEVGHNEVEAFASLARSMVPVLVRDWVEANKERDLIEAFKSIVWSSGRIRPLEVKVRAGSKLGRLLAPILFLDYVSVYLAILRGVDPTPTPWIREYRRKYSVLAR